MQIGSQYAILLFAIKKSMQACWLLAYYHLKTSFDLIWQLIRTNFNSATSTSWPWRMWPECLFYITASSISSKYDLFDLEGKGLTSWLLYVMFIVILLLSRLVSWDRCGLLDCIDSWSLLTFLLRKQQKSYKWKHHQYRDQWWIWKKINQYFCIVSRQTCARWTNVSVIAVLLEPSRLAH